uniref:Uncharacterized protein n=1 Tax=Lepeophtheirus salmonis TaxID=72036 RepID=A0A0K2TEF4_LEPSM
MIISNNLLYKMNIDTSLRAVYFFNGFNYNLRANIKSRFIQLKLSSKTLPIISFPTAIPYNFNLKNIPSNTPFSSKDFRDRISFFFKLMIHN